MGKRSLLAMLVITALSACAVDDRRLTVKGACVNPPPTGLIADFYAATPGACFSQICPPDLLNIPTVTLPLADIAGVVFPYRSPGLDVIALGLASTLANTDAASGQALRVSMVSGTPPLTASIAYDGFAMQFSRCVDTANFSAIRFTTSGNLGTCLLRFAVQFQEADAGTLAQPCPIDQCFTMHSVAVATGETTLTLSDGSGVGGPTALAGMEWEFSVPTDRPGGCTADFALDDVRLVPKP